MKELEEARKIDNSLFIKTIDGSSTFRVVVFKPNSKVFWAAPRLCICESCQNDYGTCQLFNEYSLTIMDYQLPFLRSQPGESTEPDDKSDESWDFLGNNSIVAIANNSMVDNLWFVLIIDNNCIVGEPEADDYGHIILNGVRFIKGNFLEKQHDEKDHILYSVSNKVTYFYKESILNPFVNIIETKKGLKLMNADYADILSFVEKHGYNAL